MNIVGIDLGTTYCAIAYLDSMGKACVQPVKDGHLLPSLIYCDTEDNNELLVGQIAKGMASDRPENVAGNFKRHMGKGLPIKLHNMEFTPKDLSAVLLKKLKQDFEEAVGPIGTAVITVPAHFEAEARKATLEAARIAGIPCDTLINEPTAAILSCAATKRLQGKVLVFDLGGGTFDATLAEVKGEDVKVLTSQGDLDLGGRIFDLEILLLANEAFRAEFGEPLIDETKAQLEDPNSLAFRCHQEKAEEIKKDLSGRKSSARTFIRTGDNKSLTVKINREQFEEKIAPYLGKAWTAIEVAMEDAGLTAADIDHVLLVGGSVRIPAIQEGLARIFGQGKIMTAPSVDEAVCLGAAIRAALEADSRMLNSVQRSALENKSLTDVTNRHYGTLTINVEDGRLINAIILKKDTPLPCSATETFYTIVEGQTEVECKITESSWEERDADLVQLKATATLHLPPNRPAEREVRVTYSYDINQVIQCEFLDVESGRKEVVELNLEKESDKANDFQIDDFVID